LVFLNVSLPRRYAAYYGYGAQPAPVAAPPPAYNPLAGSAPQYRQQQQHSAVSRSWKDVVNSDPRRAAKPPPPPPPLNPPPQEKKSGEEKTGAGIPGAVNEYVMRAYATCRSGHEQDAMERALKLVITQAKQSGVL
jgi:hypothetical protein